MPKKRDMDSLPQGYEGTDGPPPAQIYDASDPKSVLGLVDDTLRAYIQKIDPALLLLTERDLRRRVKPDVTLCQLKMQFWVEYGKALKDERGINAVNVWKGVCAKEYWHDVVMVTPARLAWVVTPPADHMIAMREALDLGIRRLREIVQLPIVITRQVEDRKTGEIRTERKLDAAAARLVLQAVAFLREQVHGAVLQRVAIRQETMNLHAMVPPQSGSQALPSPYDTKSIDGLESIDAQLRALEKNVSAHLSPPAVRDEHVIDFEPEDVEMEET